MPSVSPAQHRFIAEMATNPVARQHAHMTLAAAQEWLHSDAGKPWLHRLQGGIIPHRDSGGVLPGVGGIAPSGNPVANAAVQRYAGLPTEKLQELAGMLGGTPQGQIIRQVLNQKLTQPNAVQSAPAAPTAGGMPGSAAPQPMQGGIGSQQQPIARGGIVMHRAGGGPTGIPLSMANPSWARSEESAASRPSPGSGFLAGTTGGRQDAIKTTAPGGSYVLPADVIAGMGEGNSLAGAKVAQMMFSTGPGGVPLERGSRGRGPPAAPHMALPVAKGGGVQPGASIQPVALSDGEYVVPIAAILRLGGGNLKKGHQILDRFVLDQRKKHIAKLKKLKPPVGAKAA